jgi:hypothetical protein
VPAAPRPQPREVSRTKGGQQRKHDMRWKNDERDTAKTYQRIDGPTENKVLRKLVTKNKAGEIVGRLGHLTDLRVDSCSKSYMIESKRRSLPKWLHDAWVQVQQIARDYDVHPVIALTMVDEQNSYTYEGKTVPCEDIHGITAKRHADLLRMERQLKALDAAMANWTTEAQEFLDEQTFIGSSAGESSRAKIIAYEAIREVLEETE